MQKPGRWKPSRVFACLFVGDHRFDLRTVKSYTSGATTTWAPARPSSRTTTPWTRRPVQKGTVVSVSAGNNGDTSGLFATGAPGVGDKVLAVASFDNMQITVRKATLHPD